MGSRTKLFLLLMTLHGSLLITSTVAGSKLFALPFGLSASATVVSYMLTFVVLDTIAELYGDKLPSWSSISAWSGWRCRRSISN